MTKKKLTLEEEAARWAQHAVGAGGWQPAPDAVPRADESMMISLRLPKRMLAILKEFARREGVGYQVLLKKWLDDRIRQEARRIQRQSAEVHLVAPVIERRAASFSAPANAEMKEAREVVSHVDR